ncbi:hypothetical protein GCM10010990_04540 [Croceicoccus mobilis]|uniref:TIR domain-containing protein n=1 Tax=Croceicoccus mobilis TaxID=1703339 RepID=A0A917DQW7_9SPHN|nr:hypothetical protein GCM10010990_04540 [Croceicoccus mobilis]
MSLSQDRATLIRLNKQLGDLRSKEAGEVKKIADAQKKIDNAQRSAQRTSSSSMAKTYMSTASREAQKLQTAQANQSRIANQAASKTQEIGKLQERISREEERERKKDMAAEDRRRREDTARQKRSEEAAAANTQALQQRIADLEAQVSQFIEAEAGNAPRFSPVAPPGESDAYDVFISHAWEDKDDFVRELAEKATAAGLRVWYDEFAMKWGDSLRQKIDEGLSGSYFGVAVLSPSFFAKQWTGYELDGLVERALSGEGRLLPIWHRLTKDDVAKAAPSLANRLALSTSLMSVDEIVRELVNLRDIYKTKSDDPSGGDQGEP